MSGRIGDLKTAGRGWVEPLGLPSAEAMVTVGLVAIVEKIRGFGCCCRRRKGSFVVELCGRNGASD